MGSSAGTRGLQAVAGASLVLLSVTAQARPLAGVPSGIKAIEQGDGWLFADAKGMTLYTYDRDEGKPGKSSCNGDCARTWPALAASADSKPQGHWTVIKRDDGSLQWAYRGKPLYRYALDAFAGATFGDGVETVWHLASQKIPTPAGIGISASSAGHVLTDQTGHTLYVSNADRPGRSACVAKCLETWRPVPAPALANPFGDFSVVVREDGFRQWAFKQQALYRYSEDASPGDMGGERRSGWHALVLEPPPPLPSWATVQASDAGELIANAAGHTLYVHSLNPLARRFLGTAVPGCPPGADCVDPQFEPLIAAPDAKPVGSWALIKLPDGRQQWSYKGMKVFTNVNDQKPGDFKGLRFSGDRSITTIMRDGLPMQGTLAGG